MPKGLSMIRIGTRRMKLRNINPSGAIKVIFFLMIIVGITSLSLAEVFDKEIVYNTGKILPYVVADSGYWQDIQDAVDLVSSIGGGNVYIPEGVWNFVNPGESWTGARVVIPAGVNVFGAPTEKYPNGSVVEWKTVLVLPWDVPGDNSYDPPKWFLIHGNSDPNKPSRFSDIKLVGYREFDHDSTQVLRGIKVENVINFRIDHVCFRHIPEGVWIDGVYCCGVIDYCVFDNVYGVYGAPDWATRTIGYGIRIDRTTEFSEWEPITNLLGKYTNHTVFIEDCIFTKWRSCVSGNHGAHFVFRHNIVKHGFGYGELDQHPAWESPYVSGRAMEVYENYFIDPTNEGDGSVIHLWAGGGVYFNNTVSGVNYRYFIMAGNPNWNSTFAPSDNYLWNNNIGEKILWTGYGTEGINYFLYKPNWYTPYPYPHPLTLT